MRKVALSILLVTLLACTFVFADNITPPRQCPVGQQLSCYMSGDGGPLICFCGNK
jgi:hypothetical protein